MPADASISNQTELDKRSIAENQVTNLQLDANFQRRPDYFIYVFNVGARSHRVSNGHLKNVLIPGVDKGQKYVMAFKLPNIVNQCWQGADNGMIQTYGDDGRRVAMDIINPANMGIDQDYEIPKDQIVSQGANLANWGLFWSLNEVPTDEEIAKAVGRMERYYRSLLKEADQLARSGKYDKIEEFHYIAADYFGYKGAWNTKVDVPNDCPNCGASVKQGVAYHRNEDGSVCVIDWQRTVAAGIKTKKEVPEDARWWVPEKVA